LIPEFLCGTARHTPSQEPIPGVAHIDGLCVLVVAGFGFLPKEVQVKFGRILKAATLAVSTVGMIGLEGIHMVSITRRSPVGIAGSLPRDHSGEGGVEQTGVLAEKVQMIAYPLSISATWRFIRKSFVLQAQFMDALGALPQTHPRG
jgi:hypothetical protein